MAGSLGRGGAGAMAVRDCALGRVAAASPRRQGLEAAASPLDGAAEPRAAASRADFAARRRATLSMRRDATLRRTQLSHPLTHTRRKKKRETEKRNAGSRRHNNNRQLGGGEAGRLTWRRSGLTWPRQPTQWNPSRIRDAATASRRLFCSRLGPSGDGATPPLVLLLRAAAGSAGPARPQPPFDSASANSGPPFRPGAPCRSSVCIERRVLARVWGCVA